MRICVEGNIGSGKTTLLDMLANKGITVRPEPVSSWGNLLKLYYDDPVQWSLCFNLKVLHSFQHIPEGDVVVVERSPGTCRHVFGQLGYNDQHMTAGAWEIFKEYANLLSWDPEAYVYIHTPPEVCYERMQQRNRPGEESVTLEYLQRIDFQYQNFLRYCERPVHTLDGTKPPAELLDEILRLL